MKIQVGDRVLLQRLSLGAEWNIPECLAGAEAEIVAIENGNLVGRINGDNVPFPHSAVAEVIGHGTGKALT